MGWLRISFVCRNLEHVSVHDQTALCDILNVNIAVKSSQIANESGQVSPSEEISW